MKRFILYIFLLILTLPVGCSSSEDNQNADSEIDITVDSDNNNKEDLNQRAKYSIKNHPCFKDSLKIVESDENEKYLYSNSMIASIKEKKKSNTQLFSTLIESARLFNYYTEFMKILSDRVLSSEINEKSNPKYILIKAIEHLNQKEHALSVDYLNRFLSVDTTYLEDPSRYFNLHGCCQKDLDWIVNFKQTDSYEIAKILRDYSIDSVNKSEINKTDIIKKLKEYDKNLDYYDFIDNLIFIIMKNQGSEYSEFSDFFNNPQIIYSDLHGIYEDGREIYLTSQIDMLSYFKYFQSKQVLDSFDWDKIIKNTHELTKGAPPLFKEWAIDDYDNFLYALMHFYEYTLFKFSKKDSDLYSYIKEIVEIMEYDNCYSWINIFNEKNNMDESKIGNLISNPFDFNKTIELIDTYTNTTQLDSAKYFLLRDSFINKNMFDSISSNDDYVYFKKADPIYLTKIKNFIDLSGRYKTNTEFPFNLVKYFYYMYNMNTDDAREVSSQLSVNTNPYLNKGSKPVITSWNSVRSLYRALKSGGTDDKRK